MPLPSAHRHSFPAPGAGRTPLGFAFPAVMIAISAFAPSLVGQNHTATLRGTVVTAIGGEPLSGVTVYLSGGQRSTQTSDDGRFELRDLPEGAHTLIFRRIGFLPRGFRFSLTENHLGDIELGSIQIEEQVTELEEIVVETRGGGRLAGFYSRLDRGFGDFITRADIENLQPRVSTDLLRTVPGVDVRCRASDCQVQLSRQSRPLGQTVIGGSQLPDISGLGDGATQIGRQTNVSDARDVVAGLVGRTQYFCPVTYFLDGVPFDASRGINDISPHLIEGIEIYKGPAHTPAQYSRHGAACGVILIWTRQPR